MTLQPCNIETTGISGTQQSPVLIMWLLLANFFSLWPQLEMWKSQNKRESCDKQPHLYHLEKQVMPNCKITLYCANSLIVINYSSLLSQQLATIYAGTCCSHENLIQYCVKYSSYLWEYRTSIYSTKRKWMKVYAATESDTLSEKGTYSKYLLYILYTGAALTDWTYTKWIHRPGAPRQSIY